MSQHKDGHFAETMVAFLAGTATGFILGILFAPASGTETRRKLKEQAMKTGDMAREGYEKLAKEAEKGLKVVREKTAEGVDAIKEFIEKKKDEMARKTPPDYPEEGFEK